MTIFMKYSTRKAVTPIMVCCAVSFALLPAETETQTSSSLLYQNSSLFQASPVLPITVRIVGRPPFGSLSASHNSVPHPKQYAPSSFSPSFISCGVIQPTNGLDRISFTRMMRRCTIPLYLRVSRGHKHAIENRASSFTGKAVVERCSPRSKVDIRHARTGITM